MYKKYERRVHTPDSMNRLQSETITRLGTHFVGAVARCAFKIEALICSVRDVSRRLSRDFRLQSTSQASRHKRILVGDKRRCKRDLVGG